MLLKTGGIGRLKRALRISSSSKKVGLDRHYHDDAHFFLKTLPASSVIRAWPSSYS